MNRSAALSNTGHDRAAAHLRLHRPLQRHRSDRRLHRLGARTNGMKTLISNLVSLPPETNTVCAVVVAYFPDAEFEARLQGLLPQVGALVVIDNTPEPERKRNIAVPAQEGKPVCLIGNRDNAGVGSALNQGLEQALAWGFPWMITMDQDSRCHADMVRTLSTVYSACAEKPAVIGGNYHDPRFGRTKVPSGLDGEFLEQKTVITSGSMIDAAFSRSIGGFRSDYFIDQLDHEFCLRVRLHGGRVVISKKPVMEHSVGEAGGAWIPFLGRLPNHSPLRKYYIARNTVVTIADYWRREPGWCLRRLVRLLAGALSMLVFEKRGYQKLQGFVWGIADGFRRRMGACRRIDLLEK